MEKVFTYYVNDPRPLYNLFDFHSGQNVVFMVSDPNELEEYENVLQALGIEHQETEGPEHDGLQNYPEAKFIKAAATLDMMALLMQNIADVYWELFDKNGNSLGTAHDGECFQVANEETECY